MDAAIRNRLLLILSAGAGAIDAVLLIKLQVFPANMTGNTVMLANSIADRQVERFIPGLLALCGFAAGAFLGGKFVGFGDREWSAKENRALLIAAGLVVVAGFPGWIGSTEHIWIASPLCAAAMGLQAVVALHVGVQGVATNVVTGSITAAMARFATPSPQDGKLPLLSWFVYFAGALIAAVALPWINWHALWLPAAALAFAMCTAHRLDSTP